MYNSMVRTLRHTLALWLLLALVLFPVLAASAATLTFTFTLPSNCTTSAGAFDTNGNLVRTLWRRVPYVSGPHTEVWNGIKDDGSAAPAGTYMVKVLYHNMQYVWDGSIGNTSSSFDGESAWFTHSPPSGLAIDGTNAFVGTGYAEGYVGLKKFVTTQPQVALNVTPLATDMDWGPVATDGTRLYAADTGSGWDITTATLVTSFNVSDNSPATFTNGQSVTKDTPWDTVTASAIDVAVKTTPPAYDPAFDALNAATGIAVQKSGNVLAVSHGPLNVVRLFHKTTGASLGSITVTAPKGVAFNPAGDLLVCTGSGVNRYTSVGSSNTLATTISTGQPALGIAAHPTTGNDVIVVAVAGTSQQIKAYTSTGTSLWTYGSAGGYNGVGPTVSNSCFQFGATAPLAMQSDGSFWVYDAFTSRMLHISAARAYIEQIAYLSGSLVSAVDLSNPNRVFGMEWLEYSVDYTKPLLPGDPQASGGNQSWKLMRNWAAGLPAKFLSGTNGDTFGIGLNTVVTLTNPTNSADKRTYALAVNKLNGRMGLLQLPSSGNARDTGIEFDSAYQPGSSYSLYANGDLRYATYGNDVNNNYVQKIYRQPLVNFDANSNPVWGTAVLIATTPAGPKDPIGGRGHPGLAPWQFPITSSNVVVSFDQSENSTNDGFHLGGAGVGSSTTGWQWLASPAKSNDIPLDGLGSFPWGGGIQYGGNKVMATDRNIVYGFHGEFWDNSQANQYMHFYDDGLFVGQFGVPGNINRPGTGKIGGKGGNAQTPSLVTANGETYLWHSNEWPIGGVQRWHLVGANNIREMAGSVTLGGSVSLVDPGSPYPTGLTATPGNAQVSLIWQAVPGSASYKVKRATRSGGPYTTVATVTNATYTNTVLSNGTAYYYVVSAVNGSSVESANSSQVKAVPFDSTVVVQLAGEATYQNSLQTFYVDSTAPSKGMAALTLQSVFDQLGDLSMSSMGTRGYVLYDWSGIGSTTANLLPGVTVTPDGTWGHSGYASHKFVVDGVNQWSDAQNIHAWQTPSLSTSTVNINVSDTNWHYMTVFNPAIFADARYQTLKLTPQGQSTPSVTYSISDPTYGFSRIYQFRFKGNVTLTMQRLSGDNSGLLSGIFFDDVPSSTAPALPVAPTGLTATAGNGQVTLNWSAVAGATSYKVFRGTTSNGQSTTPIASNVTGTSYTNTGLTSGTTYYYKVAAVNATGTGANSNQASAAPYTLVGYGIVRATSAPTIDGTVDSIWSSAGTLNVTTVVNGSTSVTGSWKAMWDSNKLYLLATVNDASLLNGNFGYLGDSIEFYVDADNSKSTSYGANDFQYILGWGDSTITEEAHSATTGVTYAQTAISGGYRMEIAIPWSTLGITPGATNLVGIDLGIDDAATVSTRAGQLMWYGNQNNFMNPSLFGTGTLLP